MSQPRPHKRQRSSIGEMNAEDAARAERLLDKATETLETEPIRDDADVSQAVKIVKNASKTAKRVALTRQQFPKFQVKALSFSSVTAGHYASLGIFVNGNVTFNFGDNTFNTVLDALLLGVKGFRSQINPNAQTDLKVAFNGYWSAYKTFFIDMLQALLACDGGYNEAQARIIIDQFVAQLIQLMYRSAQPVQLIPEMIVSSIDDENPCTITYQTNMTILTGRIDYAVLTSQVGAKEAEALNPQSLKAQSLHKLMNAVRLSDSLRVFFVEAKNMLLDLNDFVPQVVVEATAGIHVLDSEQLLAMGWALTDGVRWIFGVVDLTKERSGADATRKVYRTDIISYKTTGLKTTAQQDAIRRILMLLILWSTVAPRMLVELFE